MCGFLLSTSLLRLSCKLENGEIDGPVAVVDCERPQGWLFVVFCTSLDHSHIVRIGGKTIDSSPIIYSIISTKLTFGCRPTAVLIVLLLLYSEVFFFHIWRGISSTCSVKVLGQSAKNKNKTHMPTVAYTVALRRRHGGAPRRSVGTDVDVEGGGGRVDRGVQ